MKGYVWVALVFLIACAQAPEQVFAPTAQITFDGCKPAQSIGEKCGQTCECLKPGECINNICSLTGQQDGSPCVENKQCLSGYCAESGICGRQDELKISYDCEKTCRDRYDRPADQCYTICKHR